MHRPRTRPRCLLHALPVLLVAASAVAQPTTVVPVADATIFTENIDGAIGQGHLFVGVNNNGATRRALVRFDLSSIPQDAVIDSVAVRFVVTKSRNVAASISLRRVLTPWTEGPTTGTGLGGGIPGNAVAGDVTWRHASVPGTLWDAMGGDYEPTGTTVAVNPVGIYYWTGGAASALAATVSDWVADPASNYGFLLRETSESTLQSAKRMGSRDASASQQPQLTVFWSALTPVEPTSWGRIKALFADPDEGLAP
jgi:hypothetical protein